MKWHKCASDLMLFPSESWVSGSDLGKLPALLLNDLVPEADRLWL